MKQLLLIILLLSALFGEDRVFIKFSSQDLYLNEPVVAKVVVKSLKKPRYITIEGLEQKALYIKLIKESNITKDDKEFTKEFYYALFPQATGDITIDKVLAKISTIEPKTGFTITNSVYTKPYKLQVSALPEGIDISGNLTMHLQSSQRSVKANTPVHLKLIIEGIANIDDIKPFHLPLKGATLYSEKPQRSLSIVDGKLHSQFTQNFTVVADESFTIAPLMLRYFNTQTKMQEILATKRVEIEIKKALFTLRELLFFLAGLFVGVLAILLLRRQKKKRMSSELELALKKAKSDQERYKILLPFANNPKYSKMLTQLEKRIYKQD